MSAPLTKCICLDFVPPGNEDNITDENESVQIESAITATDDDTNADANMRWLFSTRKEYPERRKDEKFRKLSMIMTGVRQELGITKSKHVRFWPGVKQTMKIFSETSKGCPLSFDDPKQRAAVAHLLQYNAKNYMGKEYMKAKKIKSDENRTVAAQAVQPEMVSARDPAASNAGAESNELPLTDKGASSNKDSSSLSVVDMGDTVCVTDTRTIVAIGRVINSVIQHSDGTYDFSRAEVLILARFSGKHSLECGSSLIVPMKNLRLIPCRSVDLYRKFSLGRPKRKCLRGDDCKLEVETMILVDLDEEYAKFWALVGKVKALNSAKQSLTFTWYEGYAQGHLMNSNGNEGHLIDGRWRIWQKSAAGEKTCAQSNHYYCGFTLTPTQELPDVAKEMCREYIDIC